MKYVAKISFGLDSKQFVFIFIHLKNLQNNQYEISKLIFRNQYCEKALTVKDDLINNIIYGYPVSEVKGEGLKKHLFFRKILFTDLDNFYSFHNKLCTKISTEDVEFYKAENHNCGILKLKKV